MNRNLPKYKMASRQNGLETKSEKNVPTEIFSLQK